MLQVFLMTFVLIIVLMVLAFQIYLLVLTKGIGDRLDEQISNQEKIMEEQEKMKDEFLADSPYAMKDGNFYTNRIIPEEGGETE